MSDAEDGLGVVVDAARDEAELPPDFVIREVLEVDRSDDTLIGFMREWGLLVDRGDPPGRSLPYHLARRVAEQRDAAAGQRPGAHPSLLVPLDSARVYLDTLRATVMHLVGHRDGTEQGVLDAWPANGFERPHSLDQAWLWWQEMVNAALHPWRMHVMLRPGDPRHLALHMPAPTLYNASMLQLTRYLDDVGPIGRCANERCRRMFTTQRTPRRRYADSHHAAGVRYCSHLCAKAQSERDRRRRRREESTPS